MKRHPQRNRYKLTFTDEQDKQVTAMCERLFRFMPTATAMRRILIEAAENIDAFREMGTQVPNGDQQAPTGPCPSPAPAHGLLDIIHSSEDEERVDPIQAAANLISGLDWQGGTLPKKTTPFTLAESLVATYPDFDVATCIRAAHVDMIAKGRVVKALGRYISNWMKNEKDPPAWKKERDKPGQRSMFGNQKQSDQQDYSKGVDENGNW